MTSIRAILIDDELSGLSSLQEKLARHCPEVQVEKLCDNARAGIEAIETLKPDVVFLDIEMPVMNGFNMLQKIKERDFELIFVTAYDHYAIKAIRFSALDYLLKPVEIGELKDAVQRVVEKRGSGRDNTRRIELLLENINHGPNRFSRLAVSTVDGIQFIRTNDIIYLEARVNYTHIILHDQQKLLVSRNLKEFEEILPPATFVRIHHSYIINKNFV
ncbi:MAG TPA: LytTR family DNA-binding domain-containing protein, partial [Phnomibacter sp.]|nr:LytTR family DNA-binding domain-containing protein [Phnomibacter sp.]